MNSDSLENAFYRANRRYARMNEIYQETNEWTRDLENNRNAEHYLFGLTWAEESPISAQISLPFAVPMYSIAKSFLDRPDFSPPSWEEVAAGYQAWNDNLSLLPGGNLEFKPE